MMSTVRKFIPLMNDGVGFEHFVISEVSKTVIAEKERRGIVRMVPKYTLISYPHRRDVHATRCSWLSQFEQRAESI